MRAAAASPADLPSRWAAARLASARGPEGKRVAAARVGAALEQSPNNVFLLVRLSELSREIGDAPAAASADERLARLTAGDPRLGSGPGRGGRGGPRRRRPGGGLEAPDRREPAAGDAALPAGPARRGAAVRRDAPRGLVARAGGGDARARREPDPGSVRRRCGGSFGRRGCHGRPGGRSDRPRPGLRGPGRTADRLGFRRRLSRRGRDPRLRRSGRGGRRRDELGLARHRDAGGPLDPRGRRHTGGRRSPEASGSSRSTWTRTGTSTSTSRAARATICSATTWTGRSPTYRSAGLPPGRLVARGGRGRLRPRRRHRSAARSGRRGPRPVRQPPGRAARAARCGPAAGRDRLRRGGGRFRRRRAARSRVDRRRPRPRPP